MTRALTIADRLAKYSAPAANGCIEWTGPRSHDGYGMAWIWVDGASLTRGAHRVAYAEAYGSIPEGMQVHHRCYNRVCINPAHLELRTPRQNVLDHDSHAPARLNAAKTHCARGHAFDEENTAIRAVGNGRYRRCRACTRENSRATYWRRKRERQSDQSLAASEASR